MLIDVMRSTCHRPPRLVGVVALCAAAVLAPEGALAEPVPAPSTPADSSRSTLQQADAAFQHGRALLEAGRYREACERFELSQRLDPSPGTQLNLGNCREHEGDLVQALATFERALDGARATRDPRRMQLWSDAARERIASLAPRVPQLSVRGLPERAQVSIDERPVEPAGGPWRLNPGLHSLIVSAPGMRPFVRLFEIALGQQLAIDIPALEPQAAEPRPEALESPEGARRDAVEDSQRHGVWPYVLGGLGGVLLGTSLVTGREASAARDELERDCTGRVCDPSLRSTRDRAERLAALTDVLWISGVIAAGAGVTLFVLDLGREQRAPALEAGCFGSGCGLRARGSF